MKTRDSYLKRLFHFIAVPIMSLLFFVACSKDNSDNSGTNDQIYTTSGDASGSQQNPPVSSAGSARLIGTYNASTNLWEYSISWSSLSGAATVIEFHGPADIGANGALLFSLDISAGGSNGAISASKTLTEQQEVYLRSGQIYYTMITTAHLSGEIRGQVYTLVR